MSDHTHGDRQQLLLDIGSQARAIPDLLRGAGLSLFYGDLHNHTGYSDGRGRPEDALRQMRDRGLHFAAITDHAEFFDRVTAVPDPDKWAALARQVAAANSPEFVAIRGFEWTSPRQGHSNVWCSQDYTSFLQTGDESMAAYYEWLAQAEPTPGAQVLAGFNHPGRELSCFDGCAYIPHLDERFVTLECFNRGDDYGQTYVLALDRGWHVGAIGVSDHHGEEWGSPALPRAGILARALTLRDLQAALVARRCFATRSPTLALLLAGNGAPMGSSLRLAPGETLALGVWCHDPHQGRRPVRFELWASGGTILKTYECAGLDDVRWQVEVPPQGPGEQWFFVRVVAGAGAIGYSSPIWAAWGV